MDDIDVSYQSSFSDNPAGTVVSLIVTVIFIIALWRIFAKAGRPGWASIIPIYNAYTLVKTAGLHGAVTVLLFIPFVNLIALIFVSLGLAKNFGKSGVFGIVGLWIFSLIGYLILGFGSAKYVGSKA